MGCNRTFVEIPNHSKTLPIRRATPAGRQHERDRTAGKCLVFVVELFAFVSILLSLPVMARADGGSKLSNSRSVQPAPVQTNAQLDTDACLDSLPTPQPKASSHRVVQLVNCSNQTVLGSANAAQQKGGQPLPVLPREGTWLMGKVGSGTNVLTIDIPPKWENTKCPQGTKDCVGIVGPRFWARTGCRYDLAFDKAQCETGGCGGRYDCSAARLAASVGTTVSEWTFYEGVPDGKIPPTYFKDSPDISAVDGANLNMDIQPLGGDPNDPFDTPPRCHNGPPGQCKGHDIQWLAEQYPLTIHGKDVRADANCNPADFRLRRSILTTGKPYGFVILDNTGKPQGGDSTVACFSNCARYAFPTPPDKSCNENSDDPSVNPRCFRWKTFCLGDPSKYGVNKDGITKKCTSDDDCAVAGACWDEHDRSSSIDHTCQGRAFIKNPGSYPIDGSDAKVPCPEGVCTYPYGYVDTTTTPNITYYSTQPPAGACTLATSPHAPYDANTCIGDETLHTVMPKAYTWPNDPQVYGADSPAYRVIFAPGGNGTTGITKTDTIPFCDQLPADVYNVAKNTTDCGNPIGYGALFAVAHPTTANPPNWACDLDPTGAGDEGVICKWRQTAKIQQIGLRTNFNSAGSRLQLAVTPGVTENDLLLASVTFLAGSTPDPPRDWTMVPGASVISNSNDQTTVWYHVVKKLREPASYTWTWNKTAFPAGGVTAWRGANAFNPFDVMAAVDQGRGKTATAPSIKTVTANAKLISIFGAGGATGQTFGLPSNPSGATDETGAAKVFGGPVRNSWFAHLVADRPQVTPGLTPRQSAAITSSTGDPNLANSDWTSISLALKP